MRRILSALLYLILLSASCAPQVDSAPTEISAPSNFSAPAPDMIRFALIGAPRNVNVWELFDKTGATYADYALRSEYYPRLYHLVPPSFSFQPLAAQGFPSEVIQDGKFYSATVKLRADLKWTDGSRFTADDVAFAANVALKFELGFDWGAYYQKEYLDHAEALDAATVKFIFKQKPNVGVWQYGALQGAIVQKTFWESKLTEAKKLLPDDSLKMKIENARSALATAQWDVDQLFAQLRTLRENGQGSRPLEIELAQRQNEFDHAQNDLNKFLEEYASKVNAAHQALYALMDKNEPTLGAWIFESQKDSVWVNKVNPDFPFGKPKFARAVYRVFNNEKDALAAFENNEADFILSPNDISMKSAKTNSTYSARFLIFNPAQPQFADSAFRVALSCMIDRKELAENILQNQVLPLEAFILSPQWHDAKINNPCAAMNKSDRIEYAVKLLKDAGYSWARQPTVKSAGQTLINSNGEIFPKIVLSAPSQSADALRYAAAKYIAAQAQYLGISFSVKEMSVDDVIYAVYSSRQYDAALIGWRLSEYPRYVCEGFGNENQTWLKSESFASVCAALREESNFEAAQKTMAQAESALMFNLPLIPLYSLTQADVYQNLVYPSSSVLNGWRNLYGAPSYAMPSP